MSNNKYSLRYLPIFYDDLNEVVIDDDSDNKIMEVRRLLYKRQDRDSIV